MNFHYGMEKKLSSLGPVRTFVRGSLFFFVVCLFISAQVYADKVINLRTDAEYSGANALQYAVNDAQTGDTLFIKGTVFGNTTITGSGSLASLTLLGEEFKSTLDGNQAGRVLTITGAITVTIDHLIIQNGRYAGDGGGIYVENDASLSIQDSSILYNTSTTGSGGGIYEDGGYLTLDEVDIKYNSAYINGGGLYYEGPQIRFTSTQVKYNQAYGDANASGGGMYFTGDPASITSFSTVIAHNSAVYGGGIRNTAGFNLGLDGVEIYSNEAVDGGGIYNDNEAQLLLNACLIRNNTATGEGGGLFNQGSNTKAIVTESTIIHNSANSGGGIYSGGTAELTLIDTIVKHNTPNDIEG